MGTTMTAHDDEHIDAALEALARPEPPVDHLTRVLARTAGTPSRPSAHVAIGDGMSRRTQLLRPRWLLPIAATVAAAVGGAWLVEGSLHTRLDVVMGRQADVRPVTAGSENRPSPVIRKPVDLPVLPPEAYWAMDPFEEWKRLRPSTGHQAPAVGRPAGGAGSPAAAAVAQGAWATETLPPIELHTIETAPIDIAPLAPLDDITVTAIALAPIVIAPVDAQEKP